jgi:hypothetical protein
MKKVAVWCLMLTVFLVYGASGVLAGPVLVSLNKPVTGSAYFDNSEVPYFPAEERFPWTNVNDGYFNDLYTGRPNPNAWSYWLTPNYTTGWFGIDLHGLYAVSYFEIQNTHNRAYNDRSGKDFRISLSTDGINYTTVVTDTLPNAIGVGYPLETYSLASPTLAQYVRFDLDSYYGISGGINELSVYAVPLPGAVWLLGSGLLGLVGLRRKFKK